MSAFWVCHHAPAGNEKQLSIINIIDKKLSIIIYTFCNQKGFKSVDTILYFNQEKKKRPKIAFWPKNKKENLII